MPAQKPKKTVAATGPGSDEDFEYTFESGETVTVPSLSRAKKPKPMAMMRAQAEGNQARVMILFLEAAAGDAMSVLEDLEDDELTAFLDAWSEHSGVGLGESRAS